MLDSHCHLDRYEDPKAVAAEAADRAVFTIAMTNLPSHFRSGLPHVQELSQVRLAMGLHPLAAVDHLREKELFRESLRLSSFVGEVGLDFSREGRSTRDIQLASFRFVAECVASARKVVSLHSRGAESAVLDVLMEFNVPGAIFHWYSGPLGVIDKAIDRGHYFSVNPAMTRSENGKRIIARVPRERLLTETDGPYVRIDGAAAKPWDVVRVEEYLASLWAIPPLDVRARIWRNFRELLSRLELVGVA
ncbi:MAG: TatD family hydrolase [Planctomycetes bacterium]|nr:TatD family hydrolase [Planctomycetota bacterium]